MIWYVATLIASVISTRGLAAQGELKCSAPPLALPGAFSPFIPVSGSSARPSAAPFRGRGSSSNEARSGALPGTAGGRGPEGPGGKGRESMGCRALGKRSWDPGLLRPPSAPRLHTSVPRQVLFAGAAASSSVGESAAFLTLAAGEFAGLWAGCSTLEPRAAPPLRRRALAGRRDPEPWDSWHPQLLKGQVFWPCGRPPLQLTPLLITHSGG